jgi:hypothetical protein
LKSKDGNAKNEFAGMKRIAVIFFSVVLVYGGVAWALGECLGHDRQHDHSIEVPASHSHASSPSNSRDSSGPVIHCPPAEMRLGPAIQIGSTQLRSYNATTIHAPSFRKPQSPMLAGGLWFDAVFRRTAGSLYPDGLGRHLFFSILQI